MPKAASIHAVAMPGVYFRFNRKSLMPIVWTNPSKIPNVAIDTASIGVLSKMKGASVAKLLSFRRLK